MVRRAGARARPPSSPRRMRGRSTTPHDRRAARPLARGLRAANGPAFRSPVCATPPPTSLGPCTGATAIFASTSTSYWPPRTKSKTSSPRSTATRPASSGANPGPKADGSSPRPRWAQLPPGGSQRTSQHDGASWGGSGPAETTSPASRRSPSHDADQPRRSACASKATTSSSNSVRGNNRGCPSCPSPRDNAVVQLCRAAPTPRVSRGA